MSPVPQTPSASVIEAKKAVRAQVRAVRRARAALPPDAPRHAEEGAAVDRALAPLLPAGSAAAGPVTARTVASYLSLPTEPPTGELHRRLHREGIRVIIPVLLPDKDLDWALLPPGSHELPPQPPLLGKHAIADAALVVVPALQVDREGRRLGQGGGSYDRALARRDPKAYVVAVVDDGCLVDLVPHQPHDAKVDAVVTPGTGLTELNLSSGRKDSVLRN